LSHDAGRAPDEVRPRRSAPGGVGARHGGGHLVHLEAQRLGRDRAGGAAEGEDPAGDLLEARELDAGLDRAVGEGAGALGGVVLGVLEEEGQGGGKCSTIARRSRPT
jgi:hypothetical protein